MTKSVNRLRFLLIEVSGWMNQQSPAARAGTG